MEPTSKVPKVGYRQPPTERRFVKGTSGNPAGRPKKKPGLHEAVTRELETTITLIWEGKPRMFTRGQVIAKQLVHAAVKGEHRSLKLVMEINSRREKLDALHEMSCVPSQPDLYPRMTVEEAKRTLVELLDFDPDEGERGRIKLE